MGKKEVDSYSPLTNHESLTKSAKFLLSPLAVPEKDSTNHRPKQSSLKTRKATREISPLSENVTPKRVNQVQESRRIATHPEPIQQHAGKTENQDIQLLKRKETPEERARRKAEKKKRRGDEKRRE